MQRDIPINRDIAALFRQKAEALQTKGTQYQFRAVAYVRAAQSIERLAEGLDEIYRRSWLVGLQKIEGIGNRLAHDIENELRRRGIHR
jgi:DNA polymerase/3'-5' exonuclease PolX